MKTASAQLEAEVVRPEPELSVVCSPGYSGAWKLAAAGIYRYVSKGTYYYRPLLAGGKRTYRSLKTQNLKLTEERYQALGSQNGPAAESRLKVGDILDRYEKAGYLDVNLESRLTTTEVDEKRHCTTLREFWVEIRFPDVSDLKCDSYFEWRKTLENLRQGTGRRATDRELNMLNNAFKYAKRRGLIRVNPLLDRPQYQKSASVKHCSEFRPNNSDALHNAAALLFEQPHSVVLGFQLLTEA